MSTEQNENADSWGLDGLWTHRKCVQCGSVCRAHQDAPKPICEPCAERQTRTADFDELVKGIQATFVDKPCAGIPGRPVACPQTVRTSPRDSAPRCKACAAAVDAESERQAVEYVRRAPQREFDATIPSAYGWATLNAPELPQRVKPASAIGDAPALFALGWVVFVGPSGAGKTSLAVAALRERVRMAREPWTMLLAFRLGGARIQVKAGTGEAPIVEKAMRCPFLLLDDIGQETMTANNPIADIIQERDAEQRPTWVTTGLQRAEIAQRYGGGVARRLLERSHIVRLGGVQATTPSTPPGPDVATRRAGDS